MKYQKTLKVGMGCFWKQKRWEIVGVECDRWLLGDTSNFMSEVKLVAKDQVEMIAEEVFDIGDPVYSNHTFKGIVTGFEHKTNRVICAKTGTDIQNDRSNRWAYKPHELNLDPQEIRFETNKIYVVEFICGRKYNVRALQDPQSNYAMTLYNIVDGQIIARGIKHTIGFRELLTVHSITKIEPR